MHASFPQHELLAHRSSMRYNSAVQYGMRDLIERGRRTFEVRTRTSSSRLLLFFTVKVLLLYTATQFAATDTATAAATAAVLQLFCVDKYFIVLCLTKSVGCSVYSACVVAVSIHPAL
jgi:ABC-type transport system involved in cytochrome bd biosynthesis fused ATPase/permease subunit